MGFNVERMRNEFDTPNQTGGAFNFGTLANFLRNVPSRFGALYPTSDTTRDMSETLIGGYLQDDFRLANTLTLNLGLRYEMMTIPTEANGEVALLKGLTDPEVTVGGKIHDSNPTLRNFAPRVGFAWDPFGTRKMAIRGGVGVFDVLPFLYLYETPLNRSTPLFLQGNSTNPPAGSFPSGAYALLSVQNLRTAWVDPNPPRAYRTQWNVDVQRQFGAWTADVGYVGARGTNLPLVERNMNTVMPERIGDRWVYPSRATSTVLNPNFSAINTTVTWNADPNYHGLQTVLKRNLRNGLQGQAAYTWSKSIDTGSSISSVSSGTGYESSFAVATPLLPELARGPSNYDVRHNFVGSVVWEIPSPELANRLRRQRGAGLADLGCLPRAERLPVHAGAERRSRRVESRHDREQPRPGARPAERPWLRHADQPGQSDQLHQDRVLRVPGRRRPRHPGSQPADLTRSRRAGPRVDQDAEVRRHHGADPHRDVQRAQSRQLQHAGDDHLRRPRQRDRQRRRDHHDAHVGAADAARREAALVIARRARRRCSADRVSEGEVFT